MDVHSVIQKNFFAFFNVTVIWQSQERANKLWLALDVALQQRRVNDLRQALSKMRNKYNEQYN